MEVHGPTRAVLAVFAALLGDVLALLPGGALLR